jgi:hypothetical protein
MVLFGPPIWNGMNVRPKLIAFDSNAAGQEMLKLMDLNCSEPCENLDDRRSQIALGHQLWLSCAASETSPITHEPVQVGS